MCSAAALNFGLETSQEVVGVLQQRANAAFVASQTRAEERLAGRSAAEELRALGDRRAEERRRASAATEEARRASSREIAGFLTAAAESGASGQAVAALVRDLGGDLERFRNDAAQQLDSTERQLGREARASQSRFQAAQLRGSVTRRATAFNPLLATLSVLGVSAGSYLDNTYETPEGGRAFGRQGGTP